MEPNNSSSSSSLKVMPLCPPRFHALSCRIFIPGKNALGRVYTVQGVVNLPAPSALKTVKSKSINQPVQILPTSCAGGDTRATVGRWANRRWQMERKTQPKNRVPVVCVCVCGDEKGKIVFRATSKSPGNPLSVCTI